MYLPGAGWAAVEEVGRYRGSLAVHRGQCQAPLGSSASKRPDENDGLHTFGRAREGTEEEGQ
jgi:hypothetical protein